MTKVDIRRLDSVTTNDTTATQLINENFTALQEAIENTISRDGTTPNFMDADLDLNSYKIINAGTPTNNTDVITKEYFDQNVGDAAGYAAAAEQAANRASTAAQAAQGYSSVAAGAADVAQRARDFIESDPGFVTVSTDLSLGANSEIRKVNVNKTNIDTVAGSILNVNTVSTDIANVNAVAGDLTNIDSVATNMTDINNVADDLTKIVAVADDLTNIDNVADDLTKVAAVADDLTNIDSVADNATNINAVANNESNINAVAGNTTNINAVNANKTNINAVAGNNTNITAVANNATNINAVNANKTNIDTVSTNISDINAVAADLTNIDNASAYAAEAKQWAIGDPSEPVGNSSKYWAEYAESIAEGIGDPANRDLSNLTATGELKFSNLQQQIDAIVASSDVYDIVATYAALQAYDITTVPVNDIVKVLVDETHSGAATYYRCVENGGVKSWSYIGSEGAYYTKGEADVLLAGRANIDLSNLSTTGQAVLDSKLDTTAITNCITEIPQDIKLELNNGTLTLKAGSKVYVPNGSGVFDTVTVDSDISYTPSWGTVSGLFVFPTISNNKIVGYDAIDASRIFSGSTAPTTSRYMYWYDTTNNKLKYTNDTGTTWQEGIRGFPLGLITSSSGTITSINQVFNGFGYIGSTVFALPGVKGLIPNGRNADGSLKNTEFTNSSVRTYTYTNPFDNWPVIFGYDRFYALANFKVEDTPSRIPTSGQWFSYYSPRDNKIYQSDNGGDWSAVQGYIMGNETISSGRVTSFTPKTAFHAVDYNDFSDLKDTVDAKANDSDVVKLTGNQTIDGIKMLSKQLRFQQGGTYSDAPASNQYYGQLIFRDSTGKTTGVIDNYTGTNGTTHTRLIAYLPKDNSKYTVIEASVDKNGVWSNYAATPATADSSTKIATTAFVVNVLKAVYPVGAVYIGTTSTCPLASFFGTWTLKSTGIVTSVDSNVPVKGNGITLGLTNGTQTLGLQYATMGSGATGFSGGVDSYGLDVGSNYSTTQVTNHKTYGITTDASKSGIVGTVTRSTYTVNIWERTA